MTSIGASSHSATLSTLSVDTTSQTMSGNRGRFLWSRSSGFTGTHNEAKVQPPGVVTGRYGTLGEVYLVDEHSGHSTRRSTCRTAFDRLIENNWRRIKILEEMARLIYRE